MNVSSAVTGRQSGRLRDKGRATYTRDGKIIPAGQNADERDGHDGDHELSKKPRSGSSKGKR